MQKKYDLNGVEYYIKQRQKNEEIMVDVEEITADDEEEIENTQLVGIKYVDSLQF